MVVDVIRCQMRGDTLRQILETPALDEEENEHQALIRRRDRVDQRAVSKKAKIMRQVSMAGDVRSVAKMPVVVRARLCWFCSFHGYLCTTLPFSAVQCEKPCRGCL